MSTQSPVENPPDDEEHAEHIERVRAERQHHDFTERVKEPPNAEGTLDMNADLA